MDHSTLSVLWYFVFAAAVAFYVILDGFDLGVGAIHLFARKDQDRRVFLNAIGPVWDGNEVWLVIIIGSLFAGFPGAYASIFSGFYSLLMILIAGLMLRACAIEFRSKREGSIWRACWDVVFSFSSIAVAFILGIGLGNFIEGVPMDQYHDFYLNFSSFFSPYAIMVGLTVVALLAMHGHIYLIMKTEGEIQQRLKRSIWVAIFIFFGFYIATTTTTLIHFGHMAERMHQSWSLFIVPFLAFVMILSIPYQVNKDRNGWAFVSSCLSIVLLVITYGVGTFPLLLRSTVAPNENSLTIFNSASSSYTLSVLLIIVLIGLPLVLAYGYWIYRVFRGKVQLNHMSY